MEENIIIESLNLVSEIEKAIFQEYRSLLKFSNLFHQKLDDEVRHLPYHVNVIDELHINENGHSRVLCKLLCYANSKGEYELLESLLNYIIKTGHVPEFERIKAVNPIITQETSRIDLWVRDREKKYAIIFENKIYNAIDQDAQLSRYIEKTIADGFDKKNVFVVYLSRSGNDPDPQSWGCYSEEFLSRYVNLTFNHDILSWLKHDVFPNIREKDVHLKSAVHQYVDYLEGLFFSRTINNTMNMNLNKFICDYFELDKCKDDKERARLLQDKIDEMKETIGKLNSLKDIMRQKIFDEWKHVTSARFPELHPNERGYYTDVTIGQIDGKLINVLVSVESSQLYCEVHFDENLPLEERIIENTKIMTLQDILPKYNMHCIYKYFTQDDYDGVFDMFLKTVERCKNLID